MTNMVVIAHPDDEAIWFGGLLPYLTRVKNEKVVLVCMCCTPDHIRAQELRNACDIYGSNIEIEYGALIDANLRDTTTTPVTFHIEENFALWVSRTRVLNYLTYLIRKYMPTNIYTHDLNGEGYHSNHICTALSVRDAANAAARDIYADQLTHLGRHKVLNVYFHLCNENKIEFDWSTVVDGKSLLQWANDGLQCHISQHCPPVKSNSNLWGSLKPTQMEKPMEPVKAPIIVKPTTIQKWDEGWNTRWKQSWAGHPPSKDEARIIEYLKTIDLTGKTILHMGTGGSNVAKEFHQIAGHIDSITVNNDEMSQGNALDYPNYDVHMINKYTIYMMTLGKHYDIIVDQGMIQFAEGCKNCIFNWLTMAYMLLNDGGSLYSDTLGIRYLGMPFVEFESLVKMYRIPFEITVKNTTAEWSVVEFHKGRD